MTDYEIEVSRLYAGYVKDARRAGYKQPRVCGLTALLACWLDPIGVSDAELERAFCLLMEYRKLSR